MNRSPFLEKHLNAFNEKYAPLIDISVADTFLHTVFDALAQELEGTRDPLTLEPNSTTEISLTGLGVIRREYYAATKHTTYTFTPWQDGQR